VRSPQRDSLYRHCVRAIERGMSLRGERGLPLIGTGDWNDGMNRVGQAGKGESVWLAFFLYDVLMRFSAVARLHDDAGFAEQCLVDAEALRIAIEAHAWDGAWYRRAWYDDGTPIGAAGNAECAIDSIAQSWSVLSGAGDPERSRIALHSLDTHLVRRDAKIIQLLDPPFDRSAAHGANFHDPGYIAAYLPGVRENGGQYTHAAVWAIMAFAALGEREKAWELLRLINPIHHGATREAIEIYKVEPYVVAADVYAVAPHTGRGGWTWYTGSAGWMYRLIVESLLGLRRKGDILRIAPCIPADWPSYSMDYRYGRTTYRIVVTQVATRADAWQVVVDGVGQPERAIRLVDDQQEHRVEICMPPTIADG
jgi:cyclic beta-1,2-glucan synthetase